MQKYQIALLVLALLNLTHSTPFGGFGNSDPAECTPENLANNVFMFTEINNGGQCWMTFTAQFCVDELGDLNDDPGNTRIVNGEEKSFVGSIDNECEVRVEDGQQIFDFSIFIDDDFDIEWGAEPYDCFSHGVRFKHWDPLANPPHPNQSFHLGNEGLDPYDEDVRASIFSPQPGESPQLVRFSIDFEDLESVYGCEKQTDANQFVWWCAIEYTIYFAGLPQYIYQYKMQTVLPRSVDASLQVSITKNSVQGECCTNTLGINSQLEFCLNFDCELEDGNGNQTGVQGFEVVNGIKTIVRQEIFFVAHCIATEEFKDYRLIGQDLTLNGQFQVTVHDEKELSINGFGCYVWEASSAIALPIMQIIAVSRLERPNRRILTGDEETYFGNHRVLSPKISNAPDLDQNGQPNSDYKMKGENELSVDGGISLEEVVQKDDQNKNQQASVLIFGLINIALAFLLY